MDIRNLGYSVLNGKNGTALLNSAIQAELAIDEANMSYAQLKARINEIVGKLDVIYAGPSTLDPQGKVGKLNYPAFAAPAPTVRDKTDVMAVRCIVEVKQMNPTGVAPVDLSFQFNGVPGIKTRVDLEPEIAALCLSSLGFCSDGTTPRFSRVKYISCKSIKKQ